VHQLAAKKSLKQYMYTSDDGIPFLYIQAKHAFYGSLLMGILVHQLAANADAEGVSASADTDFDVVGVGWRLLDRDNKVL